MAHLRKQIRDNVVTALTGLSTAGSPERPKNLIRPAPYWPATEKVVRFA